MDHDFQAHTIPGSLDLNSGSFSRDFALFWALPQKENAVHAPGEISLGGQKSLIAFSESLEVPESCKIIRNFV